MPQEISRRGLLKGLLAAPAVAALPATEGDQEAVTAAKELMAKVKAPRAATIHSSAANIAIADFDNYDSIQLKGGYDNA